MNLNSLTKTQHEFYTENGYLLLKQIFDVEEVRQQTREINRLMNEFGKIEKGWRGSWRRAYLDEHENEISKIMILLNPHLYSSVYFRAVTHDKLVDAVFDLLDNGVELDHSVLHAKAPTTGTPFPMHQDWPFYAHKDPYGFVDALLHIDNTDEANGCLKLLPGSHKLGPLQHVIEHGIGNELNEPYLSTTDYPIDQAIAIPAKAGDVVLMSYLTIHGSEPNQTNQWRRMVRIGYRDPRNKVLFPDDPDWKGPSFRFGEHRRNQPLGMILRGQRKNI